ncbi:MAG: endonuclease III [Candidatus Nanopelagicales bacterium]|nr:endonuclease III [Candidatus Nanopelagicales bacterium]MDZ4248666.1 endonuclease III [Candidatus Nanopelagicales bacterium]
MRRQNNRADESPLAQVRRARRIYRALAMTYPDAHCELDFEGAFQLLVATVLSAQCTDKRVNQVTPRIFARYPNPQSLAAADTAELEDLIRPTGFFRAKAANLRASSARICDEHGGHVPGTLRDLITLPGVGRKTANVILGNAFGVPGISVDTHVSRLAKRLGLTAREDADHIESDLMGLFPRAQWTQLSHVLIWHGRRCCHARRPTCWVCPISQWCPSAATLGSR